MKSTRRVHLTYTDGKVETWEVPTAQDWIGVAQSLISHLKPGTILALSGNLGVGKTTFVQTIARELGIERQIQSPTFSLMRSYTLKKPIRGIKRLIHVDAYRIKQEHELAVLDLDEELADGKSILCIEWPENVVSWLQAHQVLHCKIYVDESSK